MNKFSVFGNPIDHSLSPQIHQLFAKQAGIIIEYSKILVEPIADFQKIVVAFQKNGGLGANITVPFKLAAFQYADKLSTNATLAKAVNTLHFTKNGVFGDNTDGKGLLFDLTKNHQINLNNQAILIVGAGGATMGILPNLLTQTNNITLANRTVSKAEAIAHYFDNKIMPCSLDNIVGQFDIIINATSTSLSNNTLTLDPIIIKPKKTICYDLMYAKTPTPFMNWGKQNHARKCYDGLGMLVAQAAFSFNLWHNFMPNIKPVLEQL